MAELRLEDIGALLIGLVIVCGGYMLIGVAYDHRAPIGLLIRALWRRFFFVGDWRAAMERLADRDEGVKDYEEAGTGTAPTQHGTEPRVPAPVLPPPDAPDTGTWIPVSESLSRQELLDILARQRIDNKYVFSGNKLADLFANSPHAVSRNVILEEIARVRKSDASPPKPAQRLERPINGW